MVYRNFVSLLHLEIEPMSKIFGAIMVKEWKTIITVFRPLIIFRIILQGHSQQVGMVAKPSHKWLIVVVILLALAQCSHF